MIRAVIITEAEYECTMLFKSKRQLETYRRGFSKGADCYGAGNHGIYTLDDLPECESEGMCETAAIIRKYLEPNP